MTVEVWVCVGVCVVKSIKKVVVVVLLWQCFQVFVLFSLQPELSVVQTEG